MLHDVLRKDKAMKKQPELTALTRKTLVDTYFQIAAKGEKTTVGAITESAGYNRCTFYRYFPNTEQLLAEIEDEICAAFQKAIATHTPTIFTLEVIQSFAGVYQEYGDYISALLGKHGDPGFLEKMRIIMPPFISQLVKNSTTSENVKALKIASYSPPF